MSSKYTGWKLSDQDKIDVVSAYLQGSKIKDLAQIYRVTVEAIRHILKRRKVETRGVAIERRQYTLREDYFDIIDTEEKAYWLGLWYADGNVYRHEKRGTYTCTMSLTMEDGYLVERLRDTLYPDRDRPLWYGKAYTEEREGRTISVLPCAVLNVYSKPFALALMRLGCRPRKSLTLSFPSVQQVAPSLLSHFVRGYFDGDGCIGHYRGNTRVIDIIGSPAFIRGLRGYLRSMGIPTALHQKQSAVVSAVFGRKESVNRFRDLIYTNATVWMDRKYNTFS